MASSRDASTAPLRVALIGYGLSGSAFHAPLIVATPSLRLDAIVTRDDTRRAQAERDHPRARIVDTADRLWDNSGELDLVVVATPNRTHVPLARAALQAGTPGGVDQPVAPAARQGRAFNARAKRRRLLPNR